MSSEAGAVRATPACTGAKTSHRELDSNRVFDAFIQDPTKKILVVGANTKNWKAGIVGCKRFELWEWDVRDPDTKHKTRLPGDIGFILVTRLVDHGMTDRIRRWCEGTDIDVQVNIAPGQIKNLLQRIVNHLNKETESEAETPAAAPIQSERATRGRVKGFVMRHADFTAVNPPAEIERLESLAAQQGLEVGEGSISNAFYRLLRVQQPKTADGMPPLPLSPIGQLEELADAMELGVVNIALVMEERQKLLNQIDELTAQLATQDVEIQRLKVVERSYNKIAEEVIENM